MIILCNWCSIPIIQKRPSSFPLCFFVYVYPLFKPVIGNVIHDVVGELNLSGVFGGISDFFDEKSREYFFDLNYFLSLLALQLTRKMISFEIHAI